MYALVEQNYAEPITGDKADVAIYDGAIPGMLRVLDPHSNFYDPKAYAKMREDQHGHYYGVGMVIQQQRDQARQGLRHYAVRGHAFVPGGHSSRRRHSAVDGKPVAGRDMTEFAMRWPRR